MGVSNHSPVHLTLIQNSIECKLIEKEFFKENKNLPYTAIYWKAKEKHLIKPLNYLNQNGT